MAEVGQPLQIAMLKSGGGAERKRKAESGFSFHLSSTIPHVHLAYPLQPPPPSHHHDKTRHNITLLPIDPTAKLR